MSVDRSILNVQARAMRALLDPARGGLPAKVVAADSAIPEATLRSWAKDDPAAMPLAALWALAGVATPEQLSRFLPDGLALVRVPAGVDHAQFAEDALTYAATYAAARHERSEAGTALGPNEQADLNDKVAQLRGGK